MKKINLNNIIAVIGGLLLVCGVVTADSVSLKFPLACVALGCLFLYFSGYVGSDIDDDDDYRF